MDTTTNPAESMMDSPSPTGHRRAGCRSVGGWYIAATVFAFIVFWPVGLAMLIWAVWGRRIRDSRFSQRVADLRLPERSQFTNLRSHRPNNVALAEFLEREQERLRTEQNKLDDLVKAFGAFRNAEQRSKDQRDFDAFLKQRDTGNNDDSGVAPDSTR